MIAYNWILSLFVTVSFKLRFGGLRSHNATSTQRRLIAEFFRENYPNGTSGKKRDTLIPSETPTERRGSSIKRPLQRVSHFVTPLSTERLAFNRLKNEPKQGLCENAATYTAAASLKISCCQGGDLAERIILPG